MSICDEVMETEEDKAQIFSGLKVYKIGRLDALTKRDIMIRGGTVLDTFTNDINLLLTPSRVSVDQFNVIQEAIQQQIPLIQEEYIKYCVSKNSLIDPHQNGFVFTSLTPTYRKKLDPLTVVIEFKSTRESEYRQQFPSCLYTLTWKRKYDYKIKTNLECFKDLDEIIIKDSMKVYLVLADTMLKPELNKRGGSRNRRRKKKKKITPNDSLLNVTPEDTIFISSINKLNDKELVLRFGINGLFCSKRFNYSSFRICVDYEPEIIPEDFHFTIYTPEFKTFVRETKSVEKYYQPMNNYLILHTKSNTTKTPMKYCNISYEQISKRKVDCLDLKWLGARVGKNDDGEVFYVSFYKNKTYYRINDFVYISSEDGNKTWIVKIINLIKTRDNQMKLVGQYFYRWNDLQAAGFLGHLNHFRRRFQIFVFKEQEVFHSFEFTYVNLSKVQGKCFVSYLDYLELTPLTRFPSHYYFFKANFNRNMRTINMISDEMINLLKYTTNRISLNENAEKGEIEALVEKYNTSLPYINPKRRKISKGV